MCFSLSFEHLREGRPPGGLLLIRVGRRAVEDRLDPGIGVDEARAPLFPLGGESGGLELGERFPFRHAFADVGGRLDEHAPVEFEVVERGERAVAGDDLHVSRDARDDGFDVPR